MIALATTTTSHLTVDASTITSLLVGVGIPFLVDLVTKSNANPKFKAALATALAALASALSTVLWDPSAGWGGYVYNLFYAFGTTFLVHYTGATDVVQRKTAHKGWKGPRPRHRNTTNPAPSGPPDIRPGTAQAGGPGKGTPPRKAARKATPHKRP